MRHPIEECNQNQAAMLATLPEDRREWMARLFRIGNASYCYHNRINDLPVFDTEQPGSPPADLLEWVEQQRSPKAENRSARELLTGYFEEYLEGLPNEGLRRAEEKAGLNQAKNSLPFPRYVPERHDIGMDEFLRTHLSADDYAFHRSASAVEWGQPLKNNG